MGSSKQLQGKDVIVIPQATVSLAKAGGWNSTMAFSAGSYNFVANISFLAMFRRPRQLAGLGWTLNKSLVPEASPLHDREVDGSHVLEMPAWKKVAYVAFAILLLIGIIFTVGAVKNALR